MSELPEPTDENLLEFVMGDPEIRAEFGKVMRSPAGDTFMEYLSAGLGPLWDRKVLPVKTTVLVNLTILACLNRQHELVGRIIGVLRGGITVTEVKEIVLQIGFYVGAPAGVEMTRALHEAMEWLDERGHPYRLA